MSADREPSTQHGGTQQPAFNTQHATRNTQPTGNTKHATPIAQPATSNTRQAAFALALLTFDGVGRATANRLLARFPTPEALAATPHEQILVRLKGTPRAGAIVDRLSQASAVSDAVARAEEEIAALAARRVQVIAVGHPHWPAGLDAVAPAHRPVLLWAYGNTACLVERSVALLGRTPLPEGPYEAAQALAKRLLSAGVAPVVALKPGFDVALHRLAAGAGRASIAIAPCGLGKVEGSVRPSATAVVRAGGVLVSPFPMEHGPFDHDDRERALVQAAISRATVAFAPRAGGGEAVALAWALAAGRPAFFAGDAPPEASGARSLDEPGAVDAVLAAATAP